MNILLTGASGFIGLHLAHALRLAGHRVRCCVRRAGHAPLSAFETVIVDFDKARTAIEWLPHLHDIDVVINAVGIFSERGGATFSAVHDEAPRALFAACAIANVARIVQISALGAALDADTEFLRSKARADEFLLRQKSDALVLQPSLVFGEGGESSALFAMLASLPIIALPDGGRQLIQPVHIDDICAAVLRFIENSPRTASRRRIAAVGPQALSVRDYIVNLRAGLGRSANAVVAVRSESLAMIARIAPLPWLQPDALRMLQRGSCADAGDFAALLQREPRAPGTFVDDVQKIAREQKFRIGVAALRYCMALLWIVTGILSLGIYPVGDSMTLLARVGIPQFLQLPLLYGAALLDIALGCAIVFVRRFWLWQLQALTIVFYSLVIAWKLPEFWLHPYAPMVKNIPLLAAIYLLMQWDERRREN